MDRRNFIAGAAALAAVSCARMEKREACYNEKQCPFCTRRPGVCLYCSGTKKCTFCGGSGKRRTETPDIAEQNVKKASYEEQCPYCKGTGTCRYCNGSGSCRACTGKGTIENWDFYGRFRQSP
jgi:RecJ-like exonuclease